MLFRSIILPPVLTFYNHPRTIDDMVRHIVGKVLDIFDIDMVGFRRWDGMERTMPGLEQEKGE